MLYRVEGIVIRSMDYGESNKIVTLLTNSSGKAGVLVKGAKKVKSRFGSLAQPFTYGEFVFFRGPNGGLGSLNAGEIYESYHTLRENLDQAAYASYVAELTDRALQEDEAGGFLFEQLKACLNGYVLGKDPQIVTHLYEMRILEAAGYAPGLDACVNCGNPEGPFRISAHMGGALCIRRPGCDPSKRSRLQAAEAVSPHGFAKARLHRSQAGNESGAEAGHAEADGRTAWIKAEVAVFFGSIGQAYIDI
jgi:DNA repair protein RecO (recombination protein O)